MERPRRSNPLARAHRCLQRAAYAHRPPRADADASPKFDSRPDGDAGAGKRISHQRCANRRASTIANPRARRNRRYYADSPL